MRKCLLLLLTLINTNVIGQNITWSTAVSVAPSSNQNMHPRITLDGSNDPVVVWGSNSMGGRAMFSRWNGTSFTTPVALNPMGMGVFAQSWAGPDIASKGDTMYAILKNQPEDTGKIYLVRSFDGGQNWSAPIQVGMGMDTSRFPTLTTDDMGNPIVAYMQFENNFTAPRYVVAKSGNYGTSFSPSVMASNFAGEVCDCCPASVVQNGNTLIMLYRNNLSNIRTIWARISTDGGNTFNDSLEVDNTNWMAMSCPSSGPDGVIVGDTLYTVFRSSASGTRFYLSKASIANPQLIYSNQFGTNFTGLSLQDYPRIAQAGNSVAMVWKQLVNGSSKLCFGFTENVINGFPAAYDTIATSGVTNADIAITTGAIHVVWEDVTSGTVMYRKGTYTPASVKHVAGLTSEIEIYPNPANGYFTVSSKKVTLAEECILVDNTGKRIVLKATNPHTFSLSGVAVGIYTVQVTGIDGRNYSSKLLVK